MPFLKDGAQTVVIFLCVFYYLSRLMGKPTFCIGENQDADQLFSVLVQAGLRRTCSEATLLVFPRGGSFGDVYPFSGFKI